MSDEPAGNTGFMRLIEMFGNTREVDNPEYDRMLKVMELAVAFQGLRERGEAYRRQDEDTRDICDDIPQAYIDSIEERLGTPEILTIKSAIPFLEPSFQKNFSIFVKLIEIQRLMDVYREITERMSVRGMDGDGWRVKLLSHLRPHLSRQNQARVDTLMRLMDTAARMGSFKWF